MMSQTSNLNKNQFLLTLQTQFGFVQLVVQTVCQSIITQTFPTYAKTFFVGALLNRSYIN